MTERKEAIAELYYRSNSIKFGSFKLSIHQDHPELPDSPWYMHYPKPDELGSELMPELFSLIGDELFEMCEIHVPEISESRISGLPNGAVPLGVELARHYTNYPNNLIKFAKLTEANGKLTRFGPPEGHYSLHDDLQPVEDHVSGGRNNLLFASHVRRYGFVVKKLLAVVDRQQGGPENLAKQGIEMLSIFTANELLSYGVAASFITQSEFEVVQEYRSLNQFKLAGLSNN